MKSFALIYILYLISHPTPVCSQDTSRWNDVKGKIIIKQLNNVIKQARYLKQSIQFSDSGILSNLDTIIIETDRFRMALLRRNKYAEQYADDYSYYNNQLQYLVHTTNIDTINGIVNDIKADMITKTHNTLYKPDSSLGPTGSATDFSLVNLKVRVFVDTIAAPLTGFEIYIKRGTYFPSRDSLRISQLTDNAVIPISVGNFTVVAWKGKKHGKATVIVMRKPEPLFVCDIKIK